MDALVRIQYHAKCPMLACHGAVLSACVGATRLGRIPGQHCGRTSKFERRELSVVVFRRVLIYKTAGYGGAVRWCRERDWPFRHSNTIVFTPCTEPLKPGTDAIYIVYRLSFFAYRTLASYYNGLL